MSKYKVFEDEIAHLKANQTYREIPIVQSPNEAIITINHREMINLSSNNYLGFANHPRLKQAAKAAIDTYGVGAGAVKTIAGHMQLHQQLEEELAKFKQEEAVMLFQSGFNCNAGVISAITDAEDLILSDQLNHASIIDGVRLSRAQKKVYRHNDMDHLKELLEEHRHNHRQCLIITDGVFSMDGDLARLPEIVALAQTYNALVYVDDAHGSGVLGQSGRGTVDHFNLSGQVDFTIGTLSKALGVVGGYVATKQIVKDYLSFKARPLLFSTMLPPAVAASLLEALTMLQESTAYTDKLWENANYFKAQAQALGFDIGHSETPITPIFVYDEAKTIAFSKALLDDGVFISPIVFPTVPKGQARLRVMISAVHEKEHLDKALTMLVKHAQALNIIKS
ncbi:MAG: glycine C-acetyltransferase [Erysipelothrix sp.]|nr:glycine C-acetyltransferase [Erysipelothrix sp.]